MPICEDFDVQMDREDIACAQKCLKDSDADMIAECIRRNKCKKLVLVRNDLGAEAAKKIADAMCENTSIEFLSFDQNKFGDTGGLEFVRVLKENNTMKTIFLSSNKMSEKACDELHAANQERENPLPESLYGLVLDHRSPKSRAYHAAKAEEAKKKKKNGAFD